MPYEAKVFVVSIFVIYFLTKKFRFSILNAHPAIIHGHLKIP